MKSAERGPNYDWKQEADYYKKEYERISKLCGDLDLQGDRLSWQNDQIKHRANELIACVQFAMKNVEMSPEQHIALGDRLAELYDAINENFKDPK